jgi:hypothetical protein
MRFFSSSCGVVLCSVLCLPACGSDSKATTSGEPAVAGTPGDAQTPGTALEEVQAWLKTGAYKKWTCEPHIHTARAPSPHGYNRICSNTVISSNATSAADWPVGAAAVKELYAGLEDGGSPDAAASPTPVGYAVYLKTKADSAGGANWYWYEIVPTDSTAAPHDSTGLVANNFGVANTTAQSICVSCHSAAGTPNHVPSTGSHDEVYTPVH